MIKNIIFDFGGVLLDWNPRYLDACDGVLETAVVAELINCHRMVMFDE